MQYRVQVQAWENRSTGQVCRTGQMPASRRAEVGGELNGK